MAHSPGGAAIGSAVAEVMLPAMRALRVPGTEGSGDERAADVTGRCSYVLAPPGELLSAAEKACLAQASRGMAVSGMMTMTSSARGSGRAGRAAAAAASAAASAGGRARPDTAGSVRFAVPRRPASGASTGRWAATTLGAGSAAGATPRRDCEAEPGVRPRSAAPLASTMLPAIAGAPSARAAASPRSEAPASLTGTQWTSRSQAASGRRTVRPAPLGLTATRAVTDGPAVVRPIAALLAEPIGFWEDEGALNSAAVEASRAAVAAAIGRLGIAAELRAGVAEAEALVAAGSPDAACPRLGRLLATVLRALASHASEAAAAPTGGGRGPAAGPADGDATQQSPLAALSLALPPPSEAGRETAPSAPSAALLAAAAAQGSAPLAVRAAGRGWADVGLAELLARLTLLQAQAEAAAGDPAAGLAHALQCRSVLAAAAAVEHRGQGLYWPAEARRPHYSGRALPGGTVGALGGLAVRALSVAGACLLHLAQARLAAHALAHVLDARRVAAADLAGLMSPQSGAGPGEDGPLSARLPQALRASLLRSSVNLGVALLHAGRAAEGSALLEQAAAGARDWPGLGDPLGLAAVEACRDAVGRDVDTSARVLAVLNSKPRSLAMRPDRAMLLTDGAYIMNTKRPVAPGGKSAGAKGKKKKAGGRK